MGTVNLVVVVSTLIESSVRAAARSAASAKSSVVLPPPPTVASTIPSAVSAPGRGSPRASCSGVVAMRPAYPPPPAATGCSVGPLCGAPAYTLPVSSHDRIPRSCSAASSWRADSARGWGATRPSAEAAGRPLLHWTAAALATVSDDVVVVARPGQELPPPAGAAWRVARDARPEAGPLAGIEAGLRVVRHDLAIVVATDMPLLVPALLRAVAAACRDVDVVMPVRDGRPEPLLGAYRRAAGAVATALLDAGERRPRVLLERLRSHRLDAETLRAWDAELASLRNVNTPADLASVARLLRDRRPRATATISPKRHPPEWRPPMSLYRRVLTGQVAPGQHGEFLAAAQAAFDYQAARGIEADFAIWDSISGPASEVEIVAQFDSMQELEQFEELAAQDQTFSDLRRRVRQAMVFESASVQIFRRLG